MSGHVSSQGPVVRRPIGLGSGSEAGTRRHSRRVTLSLLVGILVVAVSLWAVNLWQLRASVEANAQWWDEPRGDSGGLLYVALGDSTAQGIGASTPAKGYVGLVADQLSEATDRPVQILNLSKSGATVRDVIEEQLPRLKGLRADMVTVGVGANDMPSYDRERFDEDLEQLLGGLPPGTVIADIPDFMHGPAREHSVEAATTTRRLAQQHGFKVVPLHAAVEEGGWSRMATDYAADWFHPNDRGYRVWADAFWGVIAPQVDNRDLSLGSHDVAGDKPGVPRSG